MKKNKITNTINDRWKKINAVRFGMIKTGIKPAYLSVNNIFHIVGGRYNNYHIECDINKGLILTIVLGYFRYIFPE